jgi:hypothetical protein
MTILAGHPFMSAVQRETGPLVIEFGSFPSDVVVTEITSLVLRHGSELAGVSVLVTSHAGERRTLEHNFVSADGKRGGAVTLLAGRAAVRSGESEAGFGMIEGRHLAPGTRVMADFAGLLDRRRVGRRRVDRRRKAIVCPTLMRIEVTAGATEVGELVGHGVVQLRLCPVTIDAGDGEVPALEREARLVVARQGKLSGLKAVHRMAGITTILACRIRELAGMWVTVAV